MTKTYSIIHDYVNQAVQASTPVLPLNQSCDVVITSSIVTLATNNPDEFTAYATTALTGSSAKDVYFGAVPTLTGGADDFSVVVAQKVIGAIVRISGSIQTFRYAPVKLVFSGTGMTTMTAVFYPKRHIAEALVLATADNSGRGQVTAVPSLTAAWTEASHPGVVSNEYVIALEPINMRDFTARGQI